MTGAASDRFRVGGAAHGRFVGVGIAVVTAAMGWACGLEVKGTGVPPTDAGLVDGPCTSDFASDPRHCGVCNHDCGGGTCTTGVCRAYVVADGADAPWYVDVDGSHVYWTSHREGGLGTGRVQRAPKGGSGTIETLADLEDSFDLVVRDASVFVTGVDARGVRRISTTGSAVTVSDIGRAYDLTESDGTIYYSARGEILQADRIYALPAAGGVARELVRLSLGADVEGVAADRAFVYWATRETNTIGRIRHDGSDREDEWQRVDAPRRITLDEDAVYFTSPTGVWRKDKSGDADATSILSAEVRWGSMAVHDRFVYVAIEDEGVVARIDKRDGAERIDVATGLDHPIGVTQDAAGVYFTERAKGRIWRVEK